MMPLSFATEGEENIIKRIGGTPEVKKHLENLGFVVGGTVTVAVPCSSKRTSNESRTTIRLPFLNRSVGTT